MSMFSLSQCLEKLLTSLPPHPIPEDALDRLVEDVIEESKQHTSTDNRRSQWELLLRNEVYRIAESEGAFPGEPDAAYYNSLCDRLDVILTFTERDACEASFVLGVLEDLLETQTVASCSHIFSWIEKRSARLTEGMVPSKGKSLTLLRTLNDLLRRVSKTGNTTTFCGRILTFLSSVFPLGDRSGVNLRGDYGPQWEPVTFKKVASEEKMDVDGATSQRELEKGDIEMKTEEKSEEKDDSSGKKADEKSAKPASGSEKSEEEKREEFYNLFWSLQLPFSRPSVLATDPEAFSNFKFALNGVIPVFKEATVKERAMMGSKVVAGSKRKREATPISSTDEGDRKYFFAKFLTSPELLDLEVADTQFRRQILFQLLILLNHLLLFTATEKQLWVTNRNRSLQLDFTLQPEDAKWVQETIVRVFDEIKQTTPNARAFAETVQTILEREKNWVRWKNDLCSPFEKQPLPVSLEEETAPIRAKMREPLGEHPHKLGSEALSEIWAMGYRDLYDLENRFNPGDVKDYVKSIEKENARIKLRKQQVEKQQDARARVVAANKPAASHAPGLTTQPAAQVPAPTPAPIAPVPHRPLATSPPLHPSLPAKPGTQPVLSAQPSPAPPPAVPTPQAAPTPAPSVVRPLEQTDPIISKAEENKQRLSWLALRLARDEYLHLFGKVGGGDVILLAQEIEREREIVQRGGSVPANADLNHGAGGHESTTPTTTQDSNKGAFEEPKVAEGVIKMEDTGETAKLSSNARNDVMPVDS